MKRKILLVSVSSFLVLALLLSIGSSYTGLFYADSTSPDKQKQTDHQKSASPKWKMVGNVSVDLGSVSGLG